MADALKTYLLVTEKKWHDAMFASLQNKLTANWVRCSAKEEFTAQNLEKIKPDLVFIPHWSYIIPSAIYSHFECIVFHMTDLPYGRGGSPLQNLIVRGHTETKISAIRVAEGIDTGPVYLKAPLLLEGSAGEIFFRSSEIIEKMIVEIIATRATPVEQRGEPVIFKRRKPEESNIAALETTQQVYDYIRMLDAEGYPNAFLDTGHFKFEFSNAAIESDNTISAHVRIIKK